MSFERNRVSGLSTEPRSVRSRAASILGAAALASISLVCTALILLARSEPDYAADWTEKLFPWVLLWITGAGIVCAICLARRPRRAAVKVTAVAITLALIVVLLEGAAGLRIVHWPLVFQKLAGDGTQFLWAYRQDPELSFRRRPFDHWEGRPASDIERGSSMPSSLADPISFTYDEWGYRNAVSRTESDIVLIGDSYIEGAHVSDDQTVARRLEERLGRAVQNLGVAGYGSKQQLIVLQKDAVRFDPEVIVWFFFEGNDLYDDETFENSFPEGAMDISDHREGMARYDSWKKRSFLNAVVRRLRIWSYPVVPSRPAYTARLMVPGQEQQRVSFADYAGVPWDEWVQGRWQSSQETLRTAITFSRQNGTEIILVFVPIKYRVYAPFVEFGETSRANDWALWPLDREFLAFCRDAGVECMSLTDAFSADVARGGMPYWPTDTHWSPAGHVLVAELLAAKINALP